MNARRVLVVCGLAAGLAAQGSVADLQALAVDLQRAPEERGAALLALQDRGALTVPVVVAALADDESVAYTAASIVRHEWRTLPAELWPALDARPRAAVALLRELAVAPRPAARAWVVGRLGSADLPPEQQCLLLGARGLPLAAGEVEPLLATLAKGEAGDGFHAAVALVPAAVADALPGRLHALLAGQAVELGRALPLLDRMSVVGWRRMLGLVVTLPPALAEDLCLHLVQHDALAYRERARAALDGEIPLEAIWLLQAAPLLDVPARRERLLVELGREDAAPALRRRAFEALVEVRCTDRRLIAHAEAGGADRIGLLRRLLDAAVQDLPAADLAGWLTADPQLATITAQALGRRPHLGAEVEAAAVRLLADAGDEGVAAEGALLEALAAALLQHGSAGALEAVWPVLRTSRRFPDFVDIVARRKVPFVHERLLAELAAPPPDGHDAEARELQLDAVRLALVTLGDRRQLHALVAHGKTRSAAFVRRCAHHALALEPRLAMQLLDAAQTVADDDLAAELIGWAAGTNAPEVEQRLLALWQEKAPSERQEMALRGLVAGPSRARLVTGLRTALRAGPLVETHDQLAYEVLATMPTPLAADDVDLLAELVLVAPLADAAGERARAQRWPDGRYGFPLVAAVAQRLRGVDPAAAEACFAATSARVFADGKRDAVSRQRLLVLWRSLEAEPALQALIGRATAALLLALPGPAELGAGPAHLFLADVARLAGDPRAAAEHARAAVRGLLRLPADRRTARLFLGERDPAAGYDPWAALAAAPFLAEAELARAAGDKPAAAAALGFAREFAGHDAATRRRIDDFSLDLPR